MSTLPGSRWPACPECLSSIVRIEEGSDVSIACRDADRSESCPTPGCPWNRAGPIHQILFFTGFPVGVSPAGRIHPVRPASTFAASKPSGTWVSSCALMAKRPFGRWRTLDLERRARSDTGVSRGLSPRNCGFSAARSGPHSGVSARAKSERSRRTTERSFGCKGSSPSQFPGCGSMTFDFDAAQCLQTRTGLFSGRRP